jgi:hypothetical protein
MGFSLQCRCSAGILACGKGQCLFPTIEIFFTYSYSMVEWFGNVFYSADKFDLLIQGLLCVLLLQDIPGAGGEAEGAALGRGRGLLPQSYPPLYHRSGYKLQATSYTGYKLSSHGFSMWNL